MTAYTYDYGLGLGAPIQSDKFRITSWVGPRARFATSGGQHSSTSHAGVDIATPVGTNLLAPMTGKVIHVVNVNDGTNKRNQRGYGNQVVIQRDDGVITQQSHLFDVNVKVGDRVQQGQVIGRTGNSGSSTGPHLDYIVIKNGMAMRPDGTAYRAYQKSWLPKSGTMASPTAPVGDMSNYAQAAPVGAAVAAPVTPDIPAPAKPAAQQDFFAELVKEQEMADKLLSLTEPRAGAVAVPNDDFYNNVAQADWNTYYGYPTRPRAL